MTRLSFRPTLSVWQPGNAPPIIALVLSNVVFQIVANSSFKRAAASGDWRTFLTWQVAGNLAGLGSVLTITWLLRFLPLSVVFPITTGLTIIGIQILAAWLLFNETISSTQWLGTMLVVLGIVLIAHH